MKKTVFVLPAFLLFLSFAFGVKATENVLDTNIQPDKVQLRQKLETQQKAAEEAQSQLQKTIKERTAASFSQTIRERNQQMLEKTQQQKEAFRLRLANLQDERKQEIVERIDRRIETMNQSYTSRFAAVLDRLQAILDQLEQKAELVKQEGIEITGVEIGIKKAQVGIDKAREAVLAQAGKEYIIQLPEEEEGLKNAVGKVVSQFRQDLREVWKLVVDAKQAVMNVIKELAKISATIIPETP